MGRSIIFFCLCFLLACQYFPGNPRPEIDYTETLVVWDTTGQKYHKLLFHTVKLNQHTISGYSIETQNTEQFQLTAESDQQFIKMQEQKGFHDGEVRCISCHISVGILKSE